MSDTIYFTITSNKDNTYKRTTYNYSFSVETPLVGKTSPVFSDEIPEDMQSVYKILSIQNPKQTGLLPPGVVAIDDSIVIFEAPPRMARVEYYETIRDHIDDDSKLKSAFIPIPWQTYVVIYDKSFNLIDTYMYYNKRPVSQYGYDEPVYLPVLPNFYSNGLLCRPFYASAEDVNMYSKDISGVIAAAFDAVWNSGWNMDLVDTILDFNGDIRKKYLYGYTEMMAYFENHPTNFKDRFVHYMNTGILNSREMLFAQFIKLLDGLNEPDILNMAFPVVSRSNYRHGAIEHHREQIRETYYCDDDEEYNEDNVDAYIEDNMTTFWSDPVSFNSMITYIIGYRSKDLDIIDPSNSDYFKHIFKHVLNAQPSVSQPDYSSEEPF